MKQVVVLCLILTFCSGSSQPMAMKPDQTIRLTPIGTSYGSHNGLVYYLIHNMTSSEMFVPFVRVDDSFPIKAILTEKTVADMIYAPQHEVLGTYSVPTCLAFKVSDAHLNSFTPLNKTYAVDENNAFYRTATIREADLKTIKTVPLWDDYAFDNQHVFYDGRLLPKVKPIEFELLVEEYARDKNTVLKLSSGRASEHTRDDERVYTFGSPEKKADEATYKALCPPRQYR